MPAGKKINYDYYYRKLNLTHLTYIQTSRKTSTSTSSITAIFGKNRKQAIEAKPLFRPSDLNSPLPFFSLLTLIQNVRQQEVAHASREAIDAILHRRRYRILRCQCLRWCRSEHHVQGRPP